MDPEGDLYNLLTFCGDAGLYFLPIAIGYTGAKKFGASPVLGILLGAMPVSYTHLGGPCGLCAVQLLGIFQRPRQDGICHVGEPGAGVRGADAAGPVS